MNREESMRAKGSASAHDDAVGAYSKVAAIVAAVVGWAVGIYVGFDLLVPLVATAIVWLVSRKLLGKPKQAIVAPFCVQAGHLVWFVVLTAMSREVVNPNLIDIAWLTIGLTWLWLKPSKLALCVLAVYQLLTLPYNLLQFSETDFGSAANKMLLVHVVWRMLALFYMGRLYYRMSRPKKNAKR